MWPQINFGPQPAFYSVLTAPWQSDAMSNCDRSLANIRVPLTSGKLSEEGGELGGHEVHPGSIVCVPVIIAHDGPSRPHRLLPLRKSPIMPSVMVLPSVYS